MKTIFYFFPGFELVYEGSERDCTCDHLLPGHLYRLRVACMSAGGQSEVSLKRNFIKPFISMLGTFMSRTENAARVAAATRGDSRCHS